MKLMTWNINGLRTVKPPLKEFLDKLDCDVICLQETKVDREHLESTFAIVEGYNTYFSFPKNKSGYSGVVTYVKDDWTPWKSEDSLAGLNEKYYNKDFIEDRVKIEGFTAEELNLLDSEGRCVMTEHKIRDENNVMWDLIIINVYCPRADLENEIRVKFKLDFYQLLQRRAEKFIDAGKLVIIVGDINTSHKILDHCDPGPKEEFENNESRKWIDGMLADTDVLIERLEKNVTHTKKETNQMDGNSELEIGKGCFVDVIRLFNPKTPHLYTNWCSLTGARQNNYGCRLDYILCNKSIVLELKMVSKGCIRPDIHGSDHCPVLVHLKAASIASPKCPSLCSKFYPQFSGKQLKIASFFSNASKESETLGYDFGNDPTFHSQSLLNDEKSTLVSISVNNTCKNKTKNKRKSSTVPNNPKPQKSIRSFLNQNNTEKGKLSKLNKVTTTLQSQHTNYSQEIFESSQKSVCCPIDTSYPDTENFNMKTLLIEKNYDISTSNDTSEKVRMTKEVWKRLLKGPPKAPLCTGHKEACLLRVVKKEGSNLGKKFWVCARASGLKNDPNARCNTFVWLK